MWVRSVSLRMFMGKFAVSKRGFCVGQECTRLWGKLLSVKEVSEWVRSVSLRLFVGKIAVSKRGFCVGQECQSTIVCGESCCQ